MYNFPIQSIKLEPVPRYLRERFTTMRTFISRTKEHGASIAIRKTSTYMRAHADTMDSSCTANLCLLFRDGYLHFKKRQLLPRTAEEEGGAGKGVAGNEVVREKKKEQGERERGREKRAESAPRGSATLGGSFVVCGSSVRGGTGEDQNRGVAW